MTQPVPSPCINVCRMHARTGLCEGCLRTLDEITVWSTLDDAGKRAVWARIEHRREAHRVEVTAERRAASGKGDGMDTSHPMNRGRSDATGC